MTKTCDHCGQDPGPTHGSTSIGGGPELILCHPFSQRDIETKPDCFRRVTVYHELIGRLKGLPADMLPRDIEHINGVHNTYTAVLDELHTLQEMINRGELSSTEPGTILSVARRLGEVRAAKRSAEEAEAARMARRRGRYAPPPRDG